MKKFLAVILSVMMIFASFSVCSFAAGDVSDYYFHVTDENGNPLVDPAKQVIIVFDLNGGTLKNGAWVYDIQDGFEFQYRVSGSYVMLPRSADEQIAGESTITLPNVNAPTNHQFNGWYCYGNVGNFDQGNSYAANTTYLIPDGAEGTVIEFRASYTPIAEEEDTMASVFNILVKVFGTIVGLLFLGDEANPAEAGQQMMSQLLASIIF